jgi:hypothetical protein
MWSAALGVATGLTALVLTGVAHGATNQPIAQTGGASISLVGIPLDVSVELNTDTGDITAVNVTDASGNPADMTATKVTPTKVRFASNDDGTTKVTVSAKRNKLSFGVRTDDLAKLVGANKWTGDIFGTGAKTTVPFTIGDEGGAPTFAFGTPTGLPADATAEDLGTWKGKHHDHDDDDDTTAGGRMAFERDGFKKVLTVMVHVHHDDDGQSKASLRITLTGNNVQRKTLADLAGDKTWTGLLCDGTTKASIAYNVSAEGTVTVTSTTPEAAKTESGHKGVMVRFETGDKVWIRLMVRDDGQAALAIGVSGRKCTNRAEVADPKVNTPTSTQPPKSERSGRDGRGSGRSGDGHRGDHKNG